MRRILVVDDDLHVGRTMRIWLEQHGFRVSTADGGPNGPAALDNGTSDPMIVDVFMPQIARLRSESATLLNVIDECLFEAEPHRTQAATPGAVAEAVRESQAKRESAEIAATSSEARRADPAVGRA